MKRLTVDGVCKLVASFAFLLLAVAALVLAINMAPVANAQPAPQPAPAAHGNIMMDLTYNARDNEMDLLVWNTVTGESKLWWYSGDNSVWKSWSGQLSAKPLEKE